MIRPGFLAELAAGMAVNFEIAALALGLGLAAGMPLALLQLSGGWARAVVAPLVGVMRAAPTFVVMFFLLYALPRDGGAGLSGTLVVALSLLPYAATYFADNGREAALALRRGDTDAALLFLPNVVRAAVVLVMSSGAGAAIGVNEGVAAVLREADRHAALSGKLAVFAVGVAAFGLIFQLGFAVTRFGVRRLSRGRVVAPGTSHVAVEPTGREP